MKNNLFLQIILQNCINNEKLKNKIQNNDKNIKNQAIFLLDFCLLFFLLLIF